MDSVAEPSAGGGPVRVRVRYPEVDRMGVAYHATYFVWFELGRTELMRALGCPYGDLEDLQGLCFPVVEAGARFRASARYDDELLVATALRDVGRSSIRFEYEVRHAQRATLLADGFTTHAAVRAGRACRLPVGLRERLAGGMERR